MTHSELAALELQARIMGWEPATACDSIVETPGPTVVSVWDAMFGPSLTGEIVGSDDNERCPVCELPHCECDEY